jgi:KaiC/GvpD/RAD55 family RecA-like ATPase
MEEHLQKIKDKTKITLEHLLKSRKEGLTITEIMKKVGLARHTVLARLHKMIGEGKVGVRQINMAKLHFWKHPPEEGKKATHTTPATTNQEKHKNLQEVQHPNNVQVTPLKEEHITKKPAKKETVQPAIAPSQAPSQKPTPTNQPSSTLDIAAIKKEIQQELHAGAIKKEQGQLLEQRRPLQRAIDAKKDKLTKSKRTYIWTGIPGLDALMSKGIPQGNSIIVAGGTGSGKSITCLQMLNYHANQGKKCLYMSFEESEEHLREHMEDFGWNPRELEQKGLLKIQRFNPFEITRSVDALLLKAKGELLIDVQPVIFPDNFTPEFIIVDSLTAISSAFTEKEDSYRIYIEQLFRFFEKINATSFMITETKQIPTIFSETGVEEFLADGVIVMYNIRKGTVKENAIEILKLRGAKHEKRIVALEITGQGIVVYPEQEVFSEITEMKE